MRNTTLNRVHQAYFDTKKRAEYWVERHEKDAGMGNVLIVTCSVYYHDPFNSERTIYMPILINKLRNIVLLSFKESNRNSMSRRANNLSLVVLRVPIASVLKAVIFLQETHHCRKVDIRLETFNRQITSWEKKERGKTKDSQVKAISVIAKFCPTQILGPPLNGT